MEAVAQRGAFPSPTLLVTLWLVQHRKGAKTIFLLHLHFATPSLPALTSVFDHRMRSTVFLAK